MYILQHQNTKLKNIQKEQILNTRGWIFRHTWWKEIKKQICQSLCLKQGHKHSILKHKKVEVQRSMVYRMGELNKHPTTNTFVLNNLFLNICIHRMPHAYEYHKCMYQSIIFFIIFYSQF